MVWILIWMYLSAVTRLAMDRLTLFGFVPYSVMKSVPVNVIIVTASGFAIVTGSWHNVLANWTLVYVITWCIDRRSPAYAWAASQQHNV